ncbi:MAG TPA: DUF4340 domain-containing protein, partial [Nitrospirae bacterium]|nr:DUF4340 domain-containing protein [Nitrospirota bacterium]
HYDLPEIKHIDKSDISRLTIKKKGSEIRLKRDNKRWIVSPGNVPADGGKVDKMLSDISGLKLTAVVSESKNYPLYKLDEAHRIEVEAFKGDDSLIKIEIGKPAQSGRHTYIKLGNDQRVFLVSNELRSGFDKTVASLRDRLVMKIVEQINEVRLYDGKRKMTIVRSEAAAPVNVNRGQKAQEAKKPKPQWRTAKGQHVKGAEVEDIINTFSNLLCDEFIAGKTKKDFTSPVYTVSLKGTKTYTISIFKEKNGKYPAVSSESNYPFLISEWKAEKIMKKFDSLVESKK